jgi:hypothetical protein
LHECRKVCGPKRGEDAAATELHECRKVYGPKRGEDAAATEPRLRVCPRARTRRLGATRRTRETSLQTGEDFPGAFANTGVGGFFGDGS